MGFQLVPKYMLESKTDQIVFPNIYLKQFISSKIGGEVVILANSLISHFQRGLRRSAVNDVGIDQMQIVLDLNLS